MLKHNETPSTPLNDLPNENWFVGRPATYRNVSDKRIDFKQDDDVKVTEAPEPRGTVYANAFLDTASKKRAENTHALRRKKRGNEITRLRNPKMDVDAEEHLGGSISKSSRYTKKSKTAKKRKNKRKTMRR